MAFQLLQDFEGVKNATNQLENDLPIYITHNLNPNFEIRDYQKEAFNRFDFYLNTYKKRVRPTQLLFQMATGSGKTLIMAGCMLQLYKQGYRNFIFFVDSTNIIEKTKDNFFNSASSKYLFAPQIQFDDTPIILKQVENFANADEECINIHFTTIQGLHSRLNNPKENALTFEDFEDKNIVLLSDEAHHMNVDTLANNKKQLSIKEFEEYSSWESTAMRIFRSSTANMLLEFTATAELHQEAIAQKYDDKLLYDYSLKKFYLAKYSKEVNVLQASLSRIERALQAIILSQYRLLVFAQHNILIKPVVMFKSNCVNIPKQRDENKIVSSEFKAEFLYKIETLKPADIEKIRDNASEKGIIKTAFEFFKTNGTTIENLIIQLKDAFAEDKTISVDSTTDKGETQIVVNTLEEPNNAIRAVFAVDALNEGWDVLNLFDIVRLYNTRDAKNGVPGKTTMSEAQLIGRGARYCPFQLDETQPKYQRKYDEDLNNPLRICEELFYHSETNSRYIDELNKALDKIGIKPITTTKRQHFLKEEFKETSFYKNGIIYINQQNKYRNEDVTQFPEYLQNKTYYYKVKTGTSSEGILLKDEEVNIAREAEIPYLVNVNALGFSVIRKAMQKLPFYTFSNLTKYYPNTNSIDEFITSNSYLGSQNVEISGRTTEVKDLTQEEKLNCALHILKTLQPDIERGNIDFKGSTVFTPNSIQKIFEDREMNFTLSADGDAETGYPMSRPKLEKHYLDLSQENWYAYQENYGTSEEKKLVIFIKGAIAKLKKRYEDVYLLRNEKSFQLYRFSDGKAFEPDFVLFLKEKTSNETVVYQLFIEPKGEGYMEGDKWKEDFLKDIENKFIIHQTLNYKLVGLPFYNSEADIQREFTLEFDKYI
ncbi:MAG: DEAD/DEAH box helicase family protein [Ferruginibacter sp.]|nr:DEAD/DEAH box helicase family protein [Ferruginibacter sp.]